MKRVIVNCSIGEHYTALADVMEPACRTHGCADVMFWRELPAGCPPHAEQMYGFKIHAMRSAIQAGYEEILWIDSTFIPIASMASLWLEIETRGWYAPIQGDARLGRWTHDRLLRHYGMTRAEAMLAPLCLSGLVGISLQTAAGRRVFHRWEAAFEAGLFNGAHRNTPAIPGLQVWGAKWEGHVSDDPDVEGHRHDEAALSAILYAEGMRPRPGTIFECEGGIIGRTWDHAN